MCSLTRPEASIKSSMDLNQSSDKIKTTIKLFCSYGGGGGGEGGGVTDERFLSVGNNRFFQGEKLPEKPCQEGRI